MVLYLVRELESGGFIMSLNVQVSKQVKDEVKRAFPVLKLIIPAAAAVAWAGGRIFFHGHDEEKVNEVDRVEEVRAVSLSGTYVRNST